MKDMHDFNIIRNLDFSQVQDYRDVKIEYAMHQVSLRTIAKTKNWQKLLLKSISIRDFAQYRLHQLLAAQDDLNEAFDLDIKRETINLRGYKKQFEKGDKKKIFERIKKSIFSLDLPYNTRNHMYVALRNYKRLPDSFVLKHDYKRHLLRYAEYLEAKRDSLIKIATLGMDAALFADFKLNQKSSKTKPVFDLEIKYIGERIKQIDNTFGNYLNSFYKLLTGEKWVSLKKECSAAREYLEETKYKLPQLVVRQELYLEQVLKTGKRLSKKSLKKINRQNLEASMLFRKYLLLYASTTLFTFIAKQQGKQDEGKLEAKKAKKLRYKSMIPNGKDLSISNIISDSGRYGKKLVEVEGVVQNLKSTVLKNKSKSEFELVESWSSNTISVHTNSLNLVRLGLSNGAYCRLNCLVMGTKKRPRLLINRLELSEFSKKSWSDYLLDRVSDYYPYILEETNMKWTIGVPYRILSHGGQS